LKKAEEKYIPPDPESGHYKVYGTDAPKTPQDFAREALQKLGFTVKTPQEDTQHKRTDSTGSTGPLE